MYLGKSIIVAFSLLCTSSAALAEEWIAERLRGTVMQLERNTWVALERGDVVPDGGKVRTAANGRLELVRGQESIALGPNTQIAVRDAAGQKMTSVIQSSGVVTIEAEKRNVQHFSVQTPILAAIVKGTQFTVTYSNGLATVDVASGVVQVQDSVHDMVVDVTRGQSAAASLTRPLDVSGPGADMVVFLIEGAAVPAAARDAVLRGDLAGAVANVSAGASAGGGIVNVSAGASTGGDSGNVSVGTSAGGASVGAGASTGSGSVGVSVGVGGGSSSGSSSSGSTATVDAGIVEVGVSLSGLGL